MITRSERYREILAVLARHGIGLVDDEFIKHKAGDRARAGDLRQACEELGLRLPGALVQFFKALGMCEGILHDIDPDSKFSD